MAKAATLGFKFDLLKKDTASKARLGRVTTPHGEIDTPSFMPVGTQGTVKSVFPRDLKEVGAQIILGNTYHLYIRPGLDIIGQAQGLHRFMGWDGPILTDSGGFQVFSLAKLREVTEEGVTFQSHFDGRKIFLSPEEAIRAQEVIGSDIAMIFDECPKYGLSEAQISKSLDLTIHWARRCKQAQQRQEQALFGIVQGGIFPKLRQKSIEAMLEIGFDGYAIGGLAVGEPRDEMYAMADYTASRLPEDQPRYLMGVGTPLDFFQAVSCGVDMFDCVNPTRYGRNGTAFTRKGMVVVRNAKYATSGEPLDQTCRCYTCQNFSQSYLRHLVNVEEMLGAQLLSLHNIAFFLQLMKEIREAIQTGQFSQLKQEFEKEYSEELR